MSDKLQELMQNAQLLVDQYNNITTDNIRFKETVLLTYSKQFLNKLLPLLEAQDLEGLQNLLAENWQFMLVNGLNYTAIPNHNISILCCNLAVSISALLKEQGTIINPLLLLMPGVETESCSENYIDFNPTTTEDLHQIISTHILGASGKYLIPVQLLVDADFEETSTWSNPYYNYAKPANYQYGAQDKIGCITAQERLRLYQHSPETSALKAAWAHYQQLCSDESTLLGQLVILRNKMTLHDAYQGNGTQENAGGGAYGALIAFFDYFEKINEEQRRRIPEAVHEEINKIHTFLTDISANENATKNVETCIAGRRTALINAMTDQEEKLDAIGITAQDKGTLINKAKEQIAACQEALKSRIEEKKYTGQDNLPLTQAVLDNLQLTLKVASLNDLRDFLSLDAEEVKNLFAQNDILQQEVLNQLHSLDDLIDLSHEIKTPVIEALFESLRARLSYKIEFKPSYIELLYHSVSKEVFQVFLTKWLLLYQYRELENFRSLLAKCFKSPEILQALLQAYPENKRLEMILFERSFFGTLLDELRDNKKSIEIVLSLMPKPQKIHLILYKNSRGNTALHNAAGNLELLKFYISFIPKKEGFDALKLTDMYGNTVLHQAVKTYVLNDLELLWFLLPFIPEDKLFDTLKLRNDNKETVFHSIAKDNHISSLQFVLSCLTKEQAFEALMLENYPGVTVYSYFVSHPLMCNIITSLVPEKNTFEVLKCTDKQGNTLLHYHAARPQNLNALLAPLSPKEKIVVLELRNRFGMTAVHFAAANFESLKILSTLLPKQKLIEILVRPTESEFTVLNSAVMDPKSVQFLFLNLPKSEMFKLLMHADKDGKTILHKIVNYPESLAVILSFLSKDQRFQLLKSVDNSGCTVLHSAAHYPEVLKVILSFLSEDQRFEILKLAVQSKHFGGKTVLHNAAISPKSIQIILSFVPKDKIFSLLELQNYSGNTVLHEAAKIPQALNSLLLSMSENERLKALQISNNEGDTALDIALQNPESIKIILSFFSRGKRFELLKTLGKRGSTVFHNATSYPESLEVILSFLPRNEKIKVPRIVNQKGQTVFEDAFSKPDALSCLLSIFSKKEVFHVLTDQSTIDTALLDIYMASDHFHNTYSYIPRSLKIILLAVPEEQRIGLLKYKQNVDQRRFFHATFGFAYSNPEIVEELMSLLPEKHWLEALKISNDSGETAVHCLVYIPSAFKKTIPFIPKGQELEVLRYVDNKGRTVLHCAANRIDSFEVLLQFIPEDQLQLVLKSADTDGNTVLHEVAKNPDLLRFIFSLIPATKEQLELLQLANNNRETVLYNALNSLKSLLFLEPLITESAWLEVLTIQTKDGRTALYEVTHNSELFNKLLLKLPIEKRLGALRVKADADGDTVFHAAFLSSLTPWQALISVLPKKDIFEALKSVNNLGNTVMHAYCYFYEQIIDVLQNFSSKEVITLLKCANYEGNTVLHRATTGPEEPIRGFLSILPKEQLFELLKLENNAGETLWHYIAHYQPKLLKDLLEPLSVEQKKEVLELRSHTGSTVFNYATSTSLSSFTLLPVLPDHYRFEALSYQYENDNTVMHLAVQNIDDFEYILSLISLESAFMLMSIVNAQEKTVWHRLAKHQPDLFIGLLSRVLEEEIFGALMHRDVYGNTVLHYFILSSESFDEIIRYMSVNDWIAALKARNTNDITVLHYAADSPIILESIVSLIPEHILLDMLLLKDDLGYTVWHIVVTKPESLDTLMHCLSRIPSFDLMKLQDKNGDSLLHFAVSYPESFLILFNCLPSRAQKVEALKLVNREGLSVARCAENSLELANIVKEYSQPNQNDEVSYPLEHAGDQRYGAASNASSFFSEPIREPEYNPTPNVFNGFD